MTTSRTMRLIGLSGLLVLTLAAPAHAQIGGVGSAGAAGIAGGGPNITGAGTGFSSPNVSPGVEPLAGNEAGAPGILAPPPIPTPGFAYPGLPGAAGTQPVTGVRNVSPRLPLAAQPRRPR